MSKPTSRILNVVINNLTINEVLNIISTAIAEKKTTLITYVTFNKINLAYENQKYVRLLHKFDIVHPDGIGVYFALRILCGNSNRIKRFTGSDLYPYIVDAGIKCCWKYFFFGDTEEVLNEIEVGSPGISVSGKISGFNYDNEKLINALENSNPDILIVGLGSPLQEEWIIENLCKINIPVILAVGDGIKVFAKRKIRGGEVIKYLGLEWVVRLVLHPIKMWRRYILGIPLFIFRIIHQKFKNN